MTDDKQPNPKYITCRYECYQRSPYYLYLFLSKVVEDREFAVPKDMKIDELLKEIRKAFRQPDNIKVALKRYTSIQPQEQSKEEEEIKSPEQLVDKGLYLVYFVIPLALQEKALKK